jgi:hypothetical protein
MTKRKTTKFKHPLPLGTIIIGGNEHPEGRWTDYPSIIEKYYVDYTSTLKKPPLNKLRGYWIRNLHDNDEAWMELKYICKVLHKPKPHKKYKKSPFKIEIVEVDE